MFDVLGDLRGRPHPPVLMLSARDSPEARGDGLRAGVDDYLEKPCHFHELLVRLEIPAKRQSSDKDGTRLAVGDCIVDTASGEIKRRGIRNDLTDKDHPRPLLRTIRSVGDAPGQPIAGPPEPIS